MFKIIFLNSRSLIFKGAFFISIFMLQYIHKIQTSKKCKQKQNIQSQLLQFL